ncbi:MAG: hypothetical protein KGY99_10630 [Phycisphaerae bacterium]|nr:hypothetical protein [Phycisphaerae bacterium]
MSYAEIHPRIFERVGEHEYRGKRRFLCTPSSAIALGESLYDTTHPDGFGTWAPKCYRYQTVRDFAPDAALVVAFYKTLRVPGHATLEVRVWHDYEKRQKDVDDNRIEGPLEEDAWQEYVITEGSNKVPVPRCQIIVKTASDTFNPDDVFGRIGCVNSREVSSFGNAIGRKGALLLLGAPNTRYWPEGKLWYINYAFAYCGPKNMKDDVDVSLWNNQCKYWWGTWVSQRVPKLEYDGTQLTNIRDHYTRRFVYKTVWTNQDGTVTLHDPGWSEKRAKLYHEASFSDLDGWLEWTVEA